MNNKEENLNNLRHSTAHLLAAAVQSLYPGAKRAIGPSIETGFYYDFDFPEGVKISEEDLPKIEDKMGEVLKTWNSMEGREVTADEAKELFKDEPYKLELIEEFSQGDQKLTVYRSGDYEDLCKGGHAENPSQEIGAFKLLSVAGAYWRGSEKNKMLTRIYGTAFPTKEELGKYVEMLEEAKKRDHKKLGKELDLFIIDEEVGKGLPLWTPKGTAVKFELENFTRELERKYGYQHVSTPYLGSEILYKTSGHLDHYTASMYKPIDMDGEKYYLRPMACPHHIKIYQSHMRSYKDLPIRYAEIADYNRYEQSGELMGMIRVRKFQLTDGHLFVAPEGLKEEFMNVVRLIQDGMKGLGIQDIVTYRFSKHDPEDKEKYFPDQDLWQKSESLMKEALDELQIPYAEAVGEAAFYGPKLDIQARNANGKEDTILTAQIDFLLPEKFDLKYINENGQEKRPVMIHRSTIGALERIFAFLIEHYAGAFPTWLSPVQVMIVPITDRNNEYGQKLVSQLKEAGVRAEIDERSDKMQAKIRDAQLMKIPYMVIIGDREQDAGQVAVRTRSGENLPVQPFEEFLGKIQDEIKERK
jgi:threonyl-tRNA synthetase